MFKEIFPTEELPSFMEAFSNMSDISSISDLILIALAELYPDGIPEGYKEHIWNDDDIITQELLQSIESKIKNSALVGTSLSILCYLILSLILSPPTYPPSTDDPNDSNKNSVSIQKLIANQLFGSLSGQPDAIEYRRLVRSGIDNEPAQDHLDRMGEFPGIIYDEFNNHSKYLVLPGLLALPFQKRIGNNYFEIIKYLNSNDNSIIDFEGFDISNFAGTKFYLTFELYGGNDINDVSNLITIIYAYCNYSSETQKWLGRFGYGSTIESTISIDLEGHINIDLGYDTEYTANYLGYKYYGIFGGSISSANGTWTNLQGKTYKDYDYHYHRLVTRTMQDVGITILDLSDGTLDLQRTEGYILDFMPGYKEYNSNYMIISECTKPLPDLSLQELVE